MAYPLKTFRVQFVAEPAEFPAGSPCRSTQDVQRVTQSIYQTLDAAKEHFVLLAMNNKNRVNGFKLISTGRLTASLVHPREVWRAALTFALCCRVFVHNHPSGEPAPSPEDQDITRRLKETGDLLGIRVLDHVVLGDQERFFSFSDRGVVAHPRICLQRLFWLITDR
jgi:DNA repair protein RadC